MMHKLQYSHFETIYISLKLSSRHICGSQSVYFPRTALKNKNNAQHRNFEKHQVDEHFVEESVKNKNINANFFGIDSDEGVIHTVPNQSEQNNLVKKLERRKNIPYVTRFGSVRYDNSSKLLSPRNHELKNDLSLKNNNSKYSNYVSSEGISTAENFNFGESKDKSFSLQTESVTSQLFQTTANKDKEIADLHSEREFSNTKKPYILKEQESKFNKDTPELSSVGNESSYIDEIYFGDEQSSSERFKSKIVTMENEKYSSKSSSKSDKSTQSSFFDEFYFNELTDNSFETDKDTQTHTVKNIEKAIEQQPENTPAFTKNDETNFIDDIYFSTSSNSVTSNFEKEVKRNVENSVNNSEDNTKSSIEHTNPSLNRLKKLDSVYSSLRKNSVLPDISGHKSKFAFQRGTSKEKLLNEADKSSHSKLENKPKPLNTIDEMKTDNSAKVHADLNEKEKTKSAIDYVKNLRAENKKYQLELKDGKFFPLKDKLDSKGFRILKHQVPSLKYYTRDEILILLKNNILYSDDDVVVLNKPYNLVMHESQTTKDPCLSEYLNDLASLLDRHNANPKLYTVHRLDKETTGCLLLARNESTVQYLTSLFAQQKISKTYWIVTIRVPDPLEGVIDIPISEGTVGSKTRMVLHPDLPKDTPYRNHSKSGRRAVTEYKVIASSGTAALVEVRPITGIKHQIRVHFGLGLSCPVLGDHKYSYVDKLVPQKLSGELLQRLHVRQSKVRYIPMHIFARTVLIPQYKDGRNLFVTSTMPVHMAQNLQKLKFRK